MKFSKTNSRDQLTQANILSQALPFMQKYSGKNITIKFGGSAMGEENLSASFAKDIVLLKQVGINPIVVHGGGPRIKKMLDKIGVKTSFINGLRVTNKETIEIVEMVLSGSINKQIVMEINKVGGKAIGMSGKDALLSRISKIKLNYLSKNKINNADLGYVGTPDKINNEFLLWCLKSDFIPVISPIGFDKKFETYNVNADTMAGKISSSIKSERLVLLTDVSGVVDKKGNLLTQINIKDINRLIKNGTIKDGMIPKVQTCVDAVKNGVKAGVILDGKISHSILLEIFTDHGVGTLITK